MNEGANNVQPKKTAHYRVEINDALIENKQLYR